MWIFFQTNAIIKRNIDTQSEWNKYVTQWHKLFGAFEAEDYVKFKTNNNLKQKSKLKHYYFEDANDSFFLQKKNVLQIKVNRWLVAGVQPFYDHRNTYR